MKKVHIKMKKLHALVLVGLLSIVSGMAHEKWLTHYPSKSKAKKLIKEGVTHLIIGDKPLQQMRLGYPSNSHLKAINLLSEMSVDIYTYTSAYPSKSVVKRLNSLGGNVQLNMGIENCLTSKSETQRLGLITRPASVAIFCWSKSQLKKAKYFVDHLRNTSQNLRVHLITNEG